MSAFTISPHPRPKIRFHRGVQLLSKPNPYGTSAQNLTITKGSQYV